MVGSVQKIIVTVTGGKDKKETDLKETAQRDLRQSHLSESTPLVVFLSIIDQNQNFIECDTERQNKPELLNLKQSHFLFSQFQFLGFYRFRSFLPLLSEFRLEIVGKFQALQHREGEFFFSV